MSIESVRAFLEMRAPDLQVIELDRSTATTALAAEALGVTEGEIAKTMSVRVRDEVVLVVMRGDARLDNQKFKRVFGAKPRMLDASEVEAVTGHPIGGVSPFGLARPLKVCCDVSLRAFAEVYPAGGSPNAAVRITPVRMADLLGAGWVDVVRGGDVFA